MLVSKSGPTAKEASQDLAQKQGVVQPDISCCPSLLGPKEARSSEVLSSAALLRCGQQFARPSSDRAVTLITAHCHNASSFPFFPCLVILKQHRSALNLRRCVSCYLSILNFSVFCCVSPNPFLRGPLERSPPSHPEKYFAGRLYRVQCFWVHEFFRRMPCTSL